jgi:Rieske Fe-S protein
MVGGLVAAYGSAAAVAGRYLFPAKFAQRRWIYVVDIDGLAPGAALPWRTPSGERISIARVGHGRTTADFVALSSICPHLGCQVRFEAQHARFFCPCHNGVFAPDGRALSGPPAEAGQDLSRYPLRVDGAVLYIELAPAQLVSAPRRAPGAAV